MQILNPIPGKLTVALRGSELSLRQFDEFKAQWQQHGQATQGNAAIELLPLVCSTPGDRDKQSSLMDSAVPEDFFTRDLDRAILDGDAELALHSAKDLPWPLPAGIAVYALLAPAEVHDELCSHHHHTLDTLPQGAKLGTSSVSRRAQVLAARPDLQIVDIRGTIAERLTWLDDGRADAIIVAACALRRLNLPAGVALPFATHPLQGHLALTGRLDRPRLAKACRFLDIRNHWGSVALVGAGPGPTGYLTLAAQALLKAADFVCYDALLDPAMLAGLSAELMFVGKRQGKHQKNQDETNELLYRLAVAGKQVVRLKGGDPLVFGRGSEEAAYLGRRLVHYSIQSGVSSAMAAAACAGIPLSERGKAASIALVNAAGSSGGGPIWTGADTQVFYMPSSSATAIAAAGLAAGADPQLPVAWVKGAASVAQQTRCGHLADLAALEIPSGDEPVLLITGPTIDQRAGNDWFDRQTRILFTGLELPATQHCDVDFRGLIHHVPYIRYEPLTLADLKATGSDRFLRPPFDYDWILFTSPRSVEAFFELLYQQRYDSRSLSGIQIASIGRTTNQALRKFGLIANLTAQDEHSQGMLAAFDQAGLSACRILLPRSDKALPILPEGLAARGHQVQPVVLYRTLPPEHKPDIAPEAYQVVIFNSPSAVQNFFTLHPRLDPAWLGQVLWKTRGPQTSSALAQELIHATISSEPA